MKSFLFWFEFQWSLQDRINYKSTMVQVMAWRQTGNKPLPEPIMTQFIDAYIWH